MSDFFLRIPLLENLGDQYGDRFASSRRWLTQTEKKLAQPIFQSSVNLESVQIIETRVVNAPTTLGNNIRVGPGQSMNNATLIHELTHVWQYQTQGNRYISDSLYHQTAAIVQTGSRSAAYKLVIIPKQSFYRYTAEQQAMIVENYFRYPKKRHNPDYARLIREVRQARPTMTRPKRYYETLYGQRNQQLEGFQDTMQTNQLRTDQTVWLLRLEF